MSENAPPTPTQRASRTSWTLSVKPELYPLSGDDALTGDVNSTPSATKRRTSVGPVHQKRKKSGKSPSSMRPNHRF